ncbi:MAG: DUF6544 family protein, partial [Pseudomonadota bacterium]
LIKVGVVGKPRHCNVVFKQKGKIKNNQEKWISFNATQYMSSMNPGFIWKAQSFPMLIRDKSMNNKGEMKISFLGLKNFARISGDEVDQSSLGRYLGELIWFPIGFLDSDISWETINNESVKATIVKGDLTLEGVFFFDQNGLIDHFETKRYRYTAMEDFIGEVGIYKKYDGLLIPDSMTAIWNLKGQKFEYFKATIFRLSRRGSADLVLDDGGDPDVLRRGEGGGAERAGGEGETDHHGENLMLAVSPKR